MLYSQQIAGCGASLLLLLLVAAPIQASVEHVHWTGDLEGRHGHDHMKRVHASPRAEIHDEVVQDKVEKRNAPCAFPSNMGLVAVTPNAQNGGWAMSPDQPCMPGTWCPYACPPGMLSYQWDPTSTAYTYPASMNGGLLCNWDGSVSKGFPDKPYCKTGVGTVDAKNDCKAGVSYCQTVLPGNEAMLIPTFVGAGSITTLAIPDMSYWASTAAHFYINTPGISTADACVWSDGSKPLGNWAPYVAGGNMDGNGNTFVKIGYNPIYAVESTTFRNVKPSFGVEIICPNGGCNGIPCRIDPTASDMGVVISANAAVGAGGASFCVVTVPPGGLAYIRTFDVGSSAPVVSSAAPADSSTKPAAAPSSTSKAVGVPAPSTLSSATSPATTSPTGGPMTTSSTKSSSTSTGDNYVSNAPHIFFENATTTALTGSVSKTTLLSSSTLSASNATISKVSSAEKATVQRCAVGLVVLALGIGWWL